MGLVDQHEPGWRIVLHYTPLMGAVLLTMMISGCGSGVAPTQQTTTTTPKSPQVYLAPTVGGTTDGGSPASALNYPLIYTIDDAGDTYSQTSYRLAPPQQEGAQILNAGQFNTTSQGFLSLDLTAHYLFNSTTNDYYAVTYPLTPAPQPGGYALELAGQAGALVQLEGQPAAPLVPTTNCPSIAKAVPYNFITIPTDLQTAASAAQGWNPGTQTAYGSVDISTTGSTVNFNNIQQFTFPPNGGSGTALAQPATPPTGACGQTAYGNTISIPGQIVVTNPGNNGSYPPQAIAGIGPTGLLVEDNGSGPPSAVGTYQNALGAGTGAVGLPAPSSALDPSTITGAQFLGFVYGSGVYTTSSPSTGWSSNLVSFGSSGASPSSCPQVPGPLTTPIYGGDFSGASSNCDLVVDLGLPSSSQNGLYPNANVWMGADYAANATASTYKFSAVAIAGQLQGKAVIFLLGVDPTQAQAWSLYLFQTN
jgi:hypothetical protein